MENIDELVSKAEQLALAGNWGEEAIKLNTRILELDNTEASSYTRLARCFKEQSNFLAAREMYLQVLTFEPENRIALNNLPFIEEKLKKEKLLQSIGNINNYEEAFAIGIGAKRRNDIKLAIAALERATKLRSTKYALNALAATYRVGNKLDMAEKIYKDILSKENNPVSQVGLAAIYRDKGLLQEARKIYENILHQNKENYYALNGLGGVYSDLDLLADAEKCFKRALEIGESPDESIRNLEKLKELYLRKKDNNGIQRIDLILSHFRNLE